MMKIKSATAWQIYGTINRLTRAYETAKTAYIQSFQFDPKNTNVLRDLMSLQIHLMDWSGAYESVIKMRNLQKHNQQYFGLLLVLLHLNGNNLQAIQILSQNIDSSFMKSLTPVEFNELYLLHVYLLMKVRKYNDAL